MPSLCACRCAIPTNVDLAIGEMRLYRRVFLIQLYLNQFRIVTKFSGVIFMHIGVATGGFSGAERTLCPRFPRFGIQKKVKTFHTIK